MATSASVSSASGKASPAVPAQVSGQKPTGQVVFSQRNGTQVLDPSLTGSVSDIARNRQSYDTLVDSIKPGAFEPALALSWSNPDPTTWEFKLRQGVKFHNGEPFNADAVKVTLERWVDPAVNAPMGTRLFPKGTIAEVQIVDDYTVRVKSEKPAAGLLSSLLIAPIMPAEATRKAGTGPIPEAIGTGPYRVTEFVKGDHVNMVAFEECWAGPPKIAALNFKDLNEDATRMAALLAGEVDIIDEISGDQAKQLKGKGGFDVPSQLTVESLYPIFNCTRSPFDNVKARQALNYGIDMQSIVTSLLQDAAIPQRAPVSPEAFPFNDKLQPYTYDIDKAKALLKEAGVANGLEIDYLVPGDRYAKGRDIAETVAASAADIGIKINVHVPDMTTGFATIADLSKWHMFQWGISDMTGDADLVLRWFFYSQPNPKNSSPSATTYHDPEIDKLLDQGITTLDRDKRAQIYNQVEQMLWTAAPALWQSHTVNLFGVNKRISGFKPNYDMRDDLRQIAIIKS